MSPTSSPGSALVACGGLVLVLSITSYWAFKAWTSSPQQWQQRLRRLRPEGSEKWPIYSLLWRQSEKHPTRELWQIRILSVVAIAFQIVALLVFGSEAVSGLRGQ